MRRFWNSPEHHHNPGAGGRLSEAQTGTRCIVMALSGGTAMKRRLMDLGVFPGQEIAVLQNDGWGPVLVGAEGARVVLGRGMAEKVVVAPGLPGEFHGRLRRRHDGGFRRSAS
ncbi:MAG: ferrous iron transport protein A [Spirochaetales bacterium]|nr:ferrous iron transport protein A [Spirochaetales bacterium]